MKTMPYSPSISSTQTMTEEGSLLSAANDEAQNSSNRRGTKRPASPDDDNRHDRERRSRDTDSMDIDEPYCMLPMHGEHKRAVSCVSFAPTLTGNLSVDVDLDPSRCYLDSPIVCASASADGSVRLWDITRSYHKSQGRDCYYTHSSNHSAKNDVFEDEDEEGIAMANGNNNGHMNMGNNDDDNENENDNGHHNGSVDYSVMNTNINAHSESQSQSTLMSPIAHITGHSRGINDLAWSPRAPNLLATASDDKTLRIWDVTRSDPPHGNSNAAHAANHHHLTNNNYHTMPNTVGQPSTGTGGGSQDNANTNGTNTDNVSDALVEFKGHSNFCFSVQFSPQGNLLVSGSFDETVKVWDVRTGICVSTLPAHSDPVTGVDFNRDGTCIVSSSHDGLMRIWDVATNECLKTIYAEKNPPVTFVKYSPNGKYILSGMLDGKLRLWNVMGRNSGLSEAVASSVMEEAMGANATLDPTMTLNKAKTTTPGINSLSIGLTTAQGRGGQCTKTYEGHVNSNYCIFSAFSIPRNSIGAASTGINSSSSSRQSIVTGSEDGNVYVYDLQTRKIRQVLRGHKDACLAVACHDREEIFASGGMSKDRMVRFWVPKATAKPMMDNAMS